MYEYTCLVEKLISQCLWEENAKITKGWLKNQLNSFIRFFFWKALRSWYTQLYFAFNQSSLRREKWSREVKEIHLPFTFSEQVSGSENFVKNFMLIGKRKTFFFFLSVDLSFLGTNTPSSFNYTLSSDIVHWFV